MRVVKPDGLIVEESYLAGVKHGLKRTIHPNKVWIRLNLNGKEVAGLCFDKDFVELKRIGKQKDLLKDFVVDTQ